jgi:hypothetical protein
MSKIGEPKVRFLSLSSLQKCRGGFLLAESALFTLPWLLFVADSGIVEWAIAFFSCLYAFCHLADVRFSFFLLSFSPEALVLRPFPRTSTRRLPVSSDILALLLDPTEHRRRSSKSSPPFDGDSSAVLKQVLCDSKRISLRISRPLPSLRRRRSAPYRQGHRA